MLFCIISTVKAQTQKSDTLKIERNEQGIIKFVSFTNNDNDNRKLSNDTVFLKSILKTKLDDSFKEVKIITDELGITHKKYQQYYKGLLVENGVYLIHGRNGYINFINGDFHKVSLSTVIPVYDEKAALDAALRYVGAKKYKWEDIGSENFVKQNTNNPTATYFPSGELLISQDLMSGSHLPRLAWKFTISSLIPNDELQIYVDALDGKILSTVSLVCSVNINCQAQTTYSGTQTITGDYNNGTYNLQETRNGVSIVTKNCNYVDNEGNVTDFSNTNTNFTSGSWSSFIQNQCALDVHWGMEKTFDFWKASPRNRNSIDNNGMAIKSYAHYASNWMGAKWVGGANSNYFCFGDGNGTIKPFVSLDICAHEFAHGINGNTNLNLLPGPYYEAGALNEGLSDIWAACVEHWAAPSKQLWKVGEEIYINTNYSCQRDLANPRNPNAAETPHPDTYKGEYWSNEGEVHFNSTVLSHWFYLLVTGGTGWNNGLTSHSAQHENYEWTVYGIGIEDAQKIVYYTQLNYLYPTCDYAQMRNLTIEAATAIFDTNSCQVKAVTDAWYAVGVGTVPFSYTNNSIDGLSMVCSTGTEFIIKNTPAACAVTWTNSNNISKTSATGNPKIFTAIGSGAGWLQATINMSPCPSRSIPVKNINWVGVPTQTVSSYENLQDFGGNCYKILPANGLYAYEGTLTVDVPTAAGATSKQWSYYSGIPGKKVAYWSASNNLVDVGAKTSNAGEILQYTAINGCGSGQSQYTFYTGDMIPPPPPLIIIPNPASTQAEVSIDENTLAETNDLYLSSASKASPFYTINVMKSNGILVYRTVYSDKKIMIPTSGLDNGIYIVSITNGMKTFQGSLIIKH